MPGLFQVGISAVVEDNEGRILLLRRSCSKDFGALEWEPISGRVEAHESIEDAVRREVLEETGLQVVSLRPFNTFHFERLGIELLGVAFACRCLDGTPQRSNEHDQHRWVSEQEYREMVLHPRVRSALELYWRLRLVSAEARHLQEELVLFMGGARVPWFTTFVRALEGIDYRTASRRPAERLNSIWAIVNHVAFWHALALRRLRGEFSAQAEAQESGWTLPAAGATDDWTRVKQELIASNAAFADAVGALSAEELERPWAPGRAPRWQLAYGLMNHTSHHTADVLIARHLLGAPIKI